MVNNYNDLYKSETNENGKYYKKTYPNLEHDLYPESLAEVHTSGLGAFETYFSMLEQQVGEEHYSRIFDAYNAYADLMQAMMQEETNAGHVIWVENMLYAVKESGSDEVLKSKLTNELEEELENDYILSCVPETKLEKSLRYSHDAKAKFQMARAESYYLLESLKESKELIQRIKTYGLGVKPTNEQMLKFAILDSIRAISTKEIYGTDEIYTKEPSFSKFYVYLINLLENSSYGKFGVLTKNKLKQTGIEMFKIQGTEVKTIPEKFAYYKNRFSGQVKTQKENTISKFNNILSAIEVISNNQHALLELKKSQEDNQEKQ